MRYLNRRFTVSQDGLTMASPCRCNTTLCFHEHPISPFTPPPLDQFK